MTFNSLIANPTATRIFALNNVYDPDVDNASGSSAQGLSEIAEQYAWFKCVGAKMTITFRRRPAVADATDTQTELNGKALPLVVGVISSTARFSATTAVDKDWLESICEQKKAAYKQLMPGQRCTLSCTYSCKKDSGSQEFTQTSKIARNFKNIDLHFANLFAFGNSGNNLAGNNEQIDIWVRINYMCEVRGQSFGVYEQDAVTVNTTNDGDEEESRT